MYTLLSTSWEEVLRDKALLDKDVLKLSQAEHNILKKLQEELEAVQNKLLVFQGKYAKRGDIIKDL